MTIPTKKLDGTRYRDESTYAEVWAAKIIFACIHPRLAIFYEFFYGQAEAEVNNLVWEGKGGGGPLKLALPILRGQAVRSPARLQETSQGRRSSWLPIQCSKA